jgi:hypothetical protein
MIAFWPGAGAGWGHTYTFHILGGMGSHLHISHFGLDTVGGGELPWRLLQA